MSAFSQEFSYMFVYPEAWWHYDYKDFRDYAIQNMAFEDFPAHLEK